MPLAQSQCLKHAAVSVLTGAAMLFGVALPTSANPFKHEFGELRQYHQHWLSVCPLEHIPSPEQNYNSTCWASTWTGNENGSVAGHFPGDRLSVIRNRSTGQLTITFVDLLTYDATPKGPLKLRFSNGAVREFQWGSDIVNHGNVANEFTFASTEVTDDILARLKATSHVIFSWQTPSGKRSLFFSAMGLTDAFEFTKSYAQP